MIILYLKYEHLNHYFQQMKDFFSKASYLIYISKFNQNLFKLFYLISICHNIILPLSHLFIKDIISRCIESVATLALGSRPRQGLVRVRDKREAWETHLTPRSVGECERMNPHTPKVTPTWGVGVLIDSRIFREQLQGSKPIKLRIFYIIGKQLKHRCFKWARITHLNI